MALTAADLRTRLIANLHNDAALTNPDDYNTFLTLGQERIVRDSPSSLGIKRATLSLVDTARDYDLASDFYQMVNIHIPTENRDLSPMGQLGWVEEVEWQSTVPSGTPEQYCITGVNASTQVWQVSFDRTPSTSMTANYWYYWMPGAISGTATPVLCSLGFAELLIWAATVCGRETKDPSGLAEAEAMYQKYLAQFRNFDPQQPARIPAWGTRGERYPRGGLLDPAHFRNF